MQGTIKMKALSCVAVILITAPTPIPAEKMSAADTVRVHEFYRLADKIQDQVIAGDDYCTLQEGDRVEFEIVQGPKGPQTTDVRPWVNASRLSTNS